MRHGATTSGPAGEPRLYRPAEVAKTLRCSEWWVKEQARKRRIPYSWIGGSYLFTAGHIVEIVRLFENRPPETGAPEKASGSATRTRRSVLCEPVSQLTARTPRRKLRPAG